jgi:hypothetical protein
MSLSLGLIFQNFLLLALDFCIIRMTAKNLTLFEMHPLLYQISLILQVI